MSSVLCFFYEENEDEGTDEGKDERGDEEQADLFKFL